MPANRPSSSTFSINHEYFLHCTLTRRALLLQTQQVFGLSLMIAGIVGQALVEGPQAKTGVARQTIPFRHLSLTKVKLDTRTPQPPPPSNRDCLLIRCFFLCS